MRIRKHLRLSSSQPHLNASSTLEPPPELHHKLFCPPLNEPSHSTLHKKDPTILGQSRINGMKDDDEEGKKARRQPTLKDALARKEQETGMDEEQDNKVPATNGRNGSAKACWGISVSSSPSSYDQDFVMLGEFEGWCKGHLSVPLNRTGANIKPINNEVKIFHSENESKEKSTNDTKKKRRSSNGEMMEGSRCSRVNGRGWRCSQHTLMGYSLCDHHLGKGRLTSMSKKIKSSSSLLCEKKGEQTTKKRKKIGVVKARSMISLLSITQAGPNTITI